MALAPAALVDYGSGTESDQDDRQGQAQEPAATLHGNSSDAASDDSYFQQSDADSDDSVTRRHRAALARQRDLGVEAEGRPPEAPILPSALSALGALDCPPDYLTPEATRQLAAPIHRGRAAPAPAQAQEGAGDGSRKRASDEAWDISRMAPKLRALKAQEPAEVGVVAAGPVRYTLDERVSSSAVTAAQVAMLGGEVARNSHSGATRIQGPAAAPNRGAEQPRKSTPAMGVSDFLDKGLGAAQLPRSKQDRKEREKLKRAKGQSTAVNWKSEAEMVLRQQYDS